jgi:hypothetical protein
MVAVRVSPAACESLEEVPHIDGRELAARLMSRRAPGGRECR